MNFVPRAVAKRKTPSTSTTLRKPVPRGVPVSIATSSGKGPSSSTEKKSSTQQETVTENSSTPVISHTRCNVIKSENEPDQLHHYSSGGHLDASNKLERDKETLQTLHTSYTTDSHNQETAAVVMSLRGGTSASSNSDLNRCSDRVRAQLPRADVEHDHVETAVGGDVIPSEEKTCQSRLSKLERLHRLGDDISSKLCKINEIRGKHGEALILSKSNERTRDSTHSTCNVIKTSSSDNDGHISKQQSRRCEDDDDNEEDDDDISTKPSVVSFSKNQRWPEEDEPVCVVCGRYGEYICDQTEADVCSLECKARNLVRMKHPVTNSAAGMQLAGDSKKSSPSPERELAEDIGPQADSSGPYVYTEHEDISDLSREQIQEIRNEVQIFVEGIDVQRPVVEFEQLNLPGKLQSNLRESGYITPTPVQMQAIPSALGLRDLMVCAQTSSGKTASFLVPLVITIYNQVLVATCEEAKVPCGLILTPTRELAMQIEEQAKQIMKGMASMRTALLVGGLPLPPQLHRLKQGVQLLVATPGRMLEIIRQQALNLSEIKLVVIDEVDTMLQLGFQQQVYDIMVHLPDNHRTLLFSATIPPSIEKMASMLLNNPVYVSVGTPSTPCSSVKQVILWVEDPSKKKKLFAILQDPKHFRTPAIVFVDSKLGADLLAQAIERTCGLTVASLHGDKPQNQRSEVLKRFKEKAYEVLVSTSVLGRGIDIPGVKMIINFDMPGSVEEYIHQIGRTGRLGSSGTAMTFINNNSKRLFLEFTGTLKPLGVVLPQELINSPHLHYQKQRHRTRHAHGQRGGQASSDQGRCNSYRMSGSRSHDRKRRKDRENVADILKRRKRKFKP